MIDWFTVAAQIINFAILVVLLRVFLYDRIVKAMSQRESEVAARWDDAESAKQQAVSELAVADEKRAAMDADRERLLAEARAEAETHRRELMAEIRSDAAKQQTRWAESMRDEVESFLIDLRRRTCEEVCRLARTTLTALADAELEQRIVNRFLVKLAEVSDEDRAVMVRSLKESQGEVLIQTSRPLSSDLSQLVINAVEQHYQEPVEVRFVQSPDLLCGIALQSGSYKLAWDLRSHLAAFEQELQRMLEEEIEAKQRPTEAA